MLGDAARRDGSAKALVADCVFTSVDFEVTRQGLEGLHSRNGCSGTDVRDWRLAFDRHARGFSFRNRRNRSGS